MNYFIVEEASGAIEGITDNPQEAIEDAKGRGGKHLVVQDDEEGTVVFDSMPGITFKI